MGYDSVYGVRGAPGFVFFVFFLSAGRRGVASIKAFPRCGGALAAQTWRSIVIAGWQEPSAGSPIAGDALSISSNF